MAPPKASNNIDRAPETPPPGKKGRGYTLFLEALRLQRLTKEEPPGSLIGPLPCL